MYRLCKWVSSFFSSSLLISGFYAHNLCASGTEIHFLSRTQPQLTATHLLLNGQSFVPSVQFFVLRAIKKSGDNEATLPDSFHDPDTSKVYSDLPFTVTNYGNDKTEGSDPKNKKSSGSGTEKDKNNKKQNSESQTTSGASSQSSPKKIMSPAELLEKLKELKKKATDKKNPKAQAIAISVFESVLAREVNDNPSLKVLLKKADNDELIFTAEAGFRALKLRFPNAIKEGKIKHLTLNLLADCTFELIRQYCAALYGEHLLTFDSERLKSFLADRGHHGGITRQHIGFTQALFPLIRYFLHSLSIMSLDEWGIYVIRSASTLSDHALVVYIQKQENGHLKVLLADSITSFSTGLSDSDRLFSPMSELAAIPA